MTIRLVLILFSICLLPIHIWAEEKPGPTAGGFFKLEEGTKMLVRIKGEGKQFGEAQRKRYCRLKQAGKIQWVLNDLETGKIISRSENAAERYFGASVAKLFVAAALLNKQDSAGAPEKESEKTGTPQRGEVDSRGEDAKLTADQVDWLRQRVSSCWNPPKTRENRGWRDELDLALGRR